MEDEEVIAGAVPSEDESVELKVADAPAVEAERSKVSSGAAAAAFEEGASATLLEEGAKAALEVPGVDFHASRTKLFGVTLVICRSLLQSAK